MAGKTKSIKQMVLQDSGARREFVSGAHRDRATGKGAFAWMPYEGLFEVAQIFEYGGLKYTPNNWRLGMPLSEYANSALRHSVKAAQGWTDENHAAMAAWNWLCFIQTRWMITNGHLPAELDDIDDWLSREGHLAAFEGIRTVNKKRLAELNRKQPDANQQRQPEQDGTHRPVRGKGRSPTPRRRVRRRAG